jgi:hypothetical protein
MREKREGIWDFLSLIFYSIHGFAGDGISGTRRVGGAGVEGFAAGSVP